MHRPGCFVAFASRVPPGTIGGGGRMLAARGGARLAGLLTNTDRDIIISVHSLIKERVMATVNATVSGQAPKRKRLDAEQRREMIAQAGVVR